MFFVPFAMETQERMVYLRYWKTRKCDGRMNQDGNDSGRAGCSPCGSIRRRKRIWISVWARWLKWVIPRCRYPQLDRFPLKRYGKSATGTGLKIVLTHTDPNRILNDTEAVIREHDVMGCDYIGIGMMPPEISDAGMALPFCRRLQGACPEDCGGRQTVDVPQPQSGI